MVRFSVVVPVFNEEGNLLLLDKQIRAVMKEMGSYEVIYVNDGSTDKSLSVLRRLGKRVIVNLQRNYGQSVALDAGFRVCKGEYVITLDADLQNDPADIPRMFAAMNDRRLDVIAGWRVKRHDPLKIQVLTRISRALRRLFISDGVHDSGCTLRIYRREAVEQLELWGEMHRYIIALLRWKGFRVGEIRVRHRPRYRGKAKYGLEKMVKGFVDLLYMWFINKYSRRPLHLFGLTSILLFALGAVMLALSAQMKLVRGVDISDNGFFTLGFFLVVLAVQFFVSGIMIDLQLRNHFNSSAVEKRYVVREVIRN